MTIQINDIVDQITPSSGTLTNNGTVVDKSLNLQGGNNLLTYSQLFSNAAWTAINNSLNVTLVVAPDGTTTATQYTGGTGGANYLSQTATIVSGQTYTISCYAQPNTTNFIQIASGSGAFGVNAYGNFQLTGSGTVGTLGSAVTASSITKIGSWYRVSITVPAISSGTITAPAISAVLSLTDARLPTNATTAIINIWGAQLELGTVASAYTPTTTAAITTTNNISVPSGQVIFPTSTKTAPSIVLGNANTGIYSRVSGSYIMFGVGGNETAYLSNGGAFTVGGSSASIAFSSATLDTTAADLILYRDAANILAQRNSTNAQTFRLYNTYTDASNYERLSIDWSTTANTATIVTQNAGTGSARNVVLTSAGGALSFGTGGALRLNLNSSQFYPQTDASIDIGVASTGRYRNAYFSGVVTTNSDASINGVTVGRGNSGIADCTALGGAALYSNISGTACTAMGIYSLFSNTSGAANTSAGYYSLFSNTTGGSNCSYGSSSLQANTIGSSSCAYGQGSLNKNTVSGSLVAIGASALVNNTTNVATLGAITSGGTGYNGGGSAGPFTVTLSTTSGATFVTYPTASITVTSGVITTCTLVSSGVGASVTSATVLTATSAAMVTAGFAAGGSGLAISPTFQSGTGNVAVGYQAGYTTSVATNNTYNGYQAGYGVTTGSNSVFMGYGSGNTTTVTTTGSQLVYIGSGSRGSAATNTNEIAIGYNAVGLGSNTTVIGNSSTTATTIYGSLTSTGVMFPQQATTAAAPAYVKGGMYFDTTLNKLRIGGATAWETVTSV